MIKIHSSRKIRFFFFFLLFSGIIVWITILLGIYKTNDRVTGQLLNNAEHELGIKKERLHGYLLSLENLLSAAADNEYIYRSLRKGQTDDVNRFFMALARSNTHFMQIRFIDTEGNEIVRVHRDRIGDTPVIVSPETLQNKAHRYYFKKINALEQGRTWFSDIDLNIEFGQIERPYKPTLRIGKAVFYEGKRAGLVIVNIFMKPFLDTFHTSSNFDLYLSDPNGKILLHADPRYNWYKYLKPDITLATHFPRMFRMLKEQTDYRGEYSYATRFTFFDDRELVLVARIKENILQEQRSGFVQMLIFIGLIAFLLALPMAYWFAVLFERLDKQLRAVIQSLGDGLFVLDRQNRTVIANPAARKILGYSLDTLQEKPLNEVLRYRDKNGSCPLFNTLREDEQFHDHDGTFHTGRGDKVTVDITASPIFIDGRLNGSVIIFKDITGYRALQREVEAKNRQIKDERDLFVSGMVVLFKWRNEEGWPVEYVSQNVRNVFGADADTFMSGTVRFSDFIHPDDKGRVIKELTENAETDADHFTHQPYRLLVQDKTRWVYDATKIIRDDNGTITHYFGYLIDITEEREKEQEYNRLAKELNQIFERSLNPIAIMDSQTHFLQVNAAYVTMTGYSKEELLGSSNLELSTEESKPAMQEAMENAQTTGSARNYQQHYLSKSGQAIPVNISISSLPGGERFLIMATDISREVAHSLELEHRIEQEVGKRMEREKVFRAIFDYAGVGINVMNISGEILENNRTLQQMLGYNYDELTHMNVSDITATEDMEQAATNMRNLLAGAIDSFAMEQRYIKKDGTPLWVKTTVTGVKNEYNEIHSLIVMQDDLTETKRLEQEKQEKEQLLNQQAKMAAMGEMIGSIAHQWKQPLNAIGLMVQDIEDAYDHNEVDKAYLQDYVDGMMQQIDFMSQTITDFRNFFKPSKEKVRFDIHTEIDNILQLTGSQYRNNNIEIEKSYLAEESVVYGLRNEFKHVIMNIINNARDAIVEYRRKNDNSAFTGRVVIHTAASDGKLRIMIDDNGGGIPETILPHIFESYVSSKGDKGTGIGLSMAKAIIEKNLDGTITAENYEEGARFTIILKRA